MVKQLISHLFTIAIMEGVIYVAKCPCPALYVGKRHRVPGACKMIIKNTQQGQTIARHVWQKHIRKSNCLSFWAVQHVKLGQRKGDLDEKLPEAKMISHLGSCSPHGQNQSFAYLPFVDE